MSIKLKIAVLMGGASFEHDVSLISGRGVVRALNSDLYEIFPIVISQDGVWTWMDRSLSRAEQLDFDPDFFFKSQASYQSNFPSAERFPARDLAFLALHGSFGEDGRVQAWLQLAGIPYSGSGILGSALALDKIQAKRNYISSSIPTPKWAQIDRSQLSREYLKQIATNLSFPWFCKDPVGGSSIAMGRAFDLVEAWDLLNHLLEKSERILIETCVTGIEVSCGFIENFQPCPATEIRVSTGEFFDYDAKYQGKSQEITPAEISTEQMTQVQALAQKCHESLGLSVYSRTDMIIAQDQIYVLETNTLPGFTPTSLLPQQAAHLGVTYSQLLDIVINRSLEVRR